MGDRYIHACTRKGTACPTSRYLTLSAVSHSPTDNADSTHNPRNSGRHSVRQPTVNRQASDPADAVALKYTISAASTTPWIASSTSPTTLLETGSTIRGKYTLVNMPLLVTTLAVEAMIVLEK